jgi:uncharacterized protein
MAVLLDSGILYALYDRGDLWHGRAVAVLKEEKGRLVVPAPVIPEVDHLLGDRLGKSARIRFYQGLASGDYLVADLGKERYGRVLELNERFASLSLGFVDAAIVAIAEQLGLRRIATSDRRDFEPLAAALELVLLPEN